MLELYFLFYRIPKEMTRLARERKRSALAWTLIAVGTWISVELFVGFAIGIVHGIGVALWGWPVESPGIGVLTYILALVAALLSVSLVSRVLRNKPMKNLVRDLRPHPTPA
jgi:uncharacterized integral membrane protein